MEPDYTREVQNDSGISADLLRTNKLIERLAERLHPVLVTNSGEHRETADSGPRSSLKLDILGINGRLDDLVQAIDL